MNLLETIKNALNERFMDLNVLVVEYPDIQVVSRVYMGDSDYGRRSVYEIVFNRGNEFVGVTTHESNRSIEYYVADIYPVKRIEVVSYAYERVS